MGQGPGQPRGRAGGGPPRPGGLHPGVGLEAGVPGRDEGANGCQVGGAARERA